MVEEYDAAVYNHLTGWTGFFVLIKSLYDCTQVSGISSVDVAWNGKSYWLLHNLLIVLTHTSERVLLVIHELLSVLTNNNIGSTA